MQTCRSKSLCLGLPIHSMWPWQPLCCYMKCLGKGAMVEVVFFDNHLLVLNKPSGMLTQPNESEECSLESLGKQWVKQHFHKPGNVFLHAAHRLDRPVSGLVLFARTSKALSRLNQSLRSHKFQKEYIALVEGLLVEKEGILEHELKRSSFCARTVENPTTETKKCLLSYQVLKCFDGCTLLRISLITGRYHQIRVQLSALGHPVVGDAKYGSKHGSKHLFLHHAALSFSHPITQLPITCKAPFPPPLGKHSALIA